MALMSASVACSAAIRATPGSMAVRASSTSRSGASENCSSSATVEASCSQAGRQDLRTATGTGPDVDDPLDLEEPQRLAVGAPGDPVPLQGLGLRQVPVARPHPLS